MQKINNLIVTVRKITPSIILSKHKENTVSFEVEDSESTRYYTDYSINVHNVSVGDRIEIIDADVWPVSNGILRLHNYSFNFVEKAS